MNRRGFLRSLGVALLCLLPLQALAAGIARVGTATASATTCTFPTHLAGDLLEVWAMRGASTTAPSLPSGFVSVLTKSNSTTTTLSARLGYRIATATNDSSGTWTNASELVCSVYRASSGNVLRIGQSASNSSTTTTVNFPALTMADSTSGNSWVQGWVAASNTTQTLTTAPSGMTNEASVVGASYQAALDDTNAGVSSWSSTNATMGAGNTVTATVEIVQAPATFALSGNVYQWIGGGGNANSGSNPGSSYTLPFDTKSGAGNTYVLWITYDGGATVNAPTGAVNGSFGSPVISALGGAGKLDTKGYLLQNITAGQETVTVSFFSPTGTLVNGTNYTITTLGTTTWTTYGAASNTVGLVFTSNTSGAVTGTGTATQAVTVFQYCMGELYGVATTGGSQGSHSVAASTTIGAGSYTPTNNNATGGNLLLSYFAKAVVTPAGLTTSIFPGANETLLNADIGWGNAADSMTKASEGYVQATSAAINPSITSVAESTDAWNSASMAVAISAGSGTAPPSGIQVNSVQHFTTKHFPSSGTYPLQVVAIGNLGVIASDDGGLHAQTITDGAGNTWSGDGGVGTGIDYLPAATANSNLMLFLTGGGTDTAVSWRYMDLSGAATSPFDSATASAGQNTSGLSSFTASPSPSAAGSPEMTIANIGLGAGPGLAVTAPTGAIWDLALYTGEVDSDEIENADIMAHYTNTASGSQTWTFTITNQASNNTSGGFILFKQAPAATGNASQFFLGRNAANDDHFCWRDERRVAGF